MTVELAAAVLYRNVNLSMIDIHGERVTKMFNIDATVIDATIDAALTAFFNLTNASIVKGRVGGRKVTGITASPQNVQYSTIGDMVVLTFAQTSPENAEITLYKPFAIPAPIGSLIDTDYISVVAPDAGGSGAPLALYTLTTFLAAHLVAYIRSADTVVPGGWTYMPTMSGLAGSGRKYDARPG